MTSANRPYDGSFKIKSHRAATVGGQTKKLMRAIVSGVELRYRQVQNVCTTIVSY
jgi:hypothetical protein